MAARPKTLRSQLLTPRRRTRPPFANADPRYRTHPRVPNASTLSEPRLARLQRSLYLYQRVVPQRIHGAPIKKDTPSPAKTTSPQEPHQCPLSFLQNTSLLRRHRTSRRRRSLLRTLGHRLLRSLVSSRLCVRFSHELAILRRPIRRHARLVVNLRVQVHPNHTLCCRIRNISSRRRRCSRCLHFRRFRSGRRCRSRRLSR